jgi:virginiamycin B lyase
MMGTLAAPDDTIWFAEQNANYLGHYFPTTGHYQLYPLPWLSIADPTHAGRKQTLPSAPNELVQDRQGRIWFTEFYADRLGRLDPRTGRVQHYPLDAVRSVQKWYPYGITVAPDGMIWFTQMSTNRLGRLDPVTGRMRFFTMPGPPLPLMELASDAQDLIWATPFSSGLLVRFDSATMTFTF